MMMCSLSDYTEPNTECECLIENWLFRLNVELFSLDFSLCISCMEIAIVIDWLLCIQKIGKCFEVVNDKKTVKRNQVVTCRSKQRATYNF